MLNVHKINPINCLYFASKIAHKKVAETAWLFFQGSLSFKRKGGCSICLSKDDLRARHLFFECNPKYTWLHEAVLIINKFNPCESTFEWKRIETWRQVGDSNPKFHRLKLVICCLIRTMWIEHWIPSKNPIFTLKKIISDAVSVELHKAQQSKNYETVLARTDEWKKLWLPENFFTYKNKYTRLI
jgi:hypothetical protein